MSVALSAALCGCFALAGAATAQPVYPEIVNIDFSQFAEGTSISDQYAAYGVGFTIAGNPGALPVIAQRGSPAVAFVGTRGDDWHMWGGEYGLTDPVGPGGDIYDFQPVRIHFDPPVSVVRFFDADTTSTGPLILPLTPEFTFAQGGNGAWTWYAVDTGLDWFFRYQIFPPGPSSPITSVTVRRNPNWATPGLGYALNTLQFTRPPQQPLVGPFVRVAQESAPGAGDFDHNVRGVIRPARNPPGATSTAGRLYHYANNFNWQSFGGLSGYFGLTPGESRIFFADTTEGLSMFVVHSRGIEVLSSPPEYPGGRAEMRVEFDGIVGQLLNTVRDDPDDAYSFDSAGRIFTAVSEWTARNSDGFVISGLDGE